MTPSHFDAAVEICIGQLARLAERVDAHLERLLARRDGQPRGLELKEVAGRLDTPERNVRRMVADGRLPSVKLGRQRRVPESAVHALLDKGAAS